MAKRALITGVTGQDGSYPAEFLLDKGYEVHGLIRRASEELGWKPTVLTPELARLMVDADRELVARQHV